MDELLATVKRVLEEDLARSTNKTPWPVRLGDMSYPICYATQLYYVPKEVAQLYKTLLLSEPNTFLSSIKEIAQRCAGSQSLLGKNSFFQRLTGTARSPATQAVFDWLNQLVKGHNVSSLDIANEIVQKIERSLQENTNPWPMGWAGISASLTIESSQKTFRVPPEIEQLYTLAKLHQDEKALKNTVIKMIGALHKTLEHEAKDWAHADVIDMPFLFAFGLRNKSLHRLSDTLNRLVVEDSSKIVESKDTEKTYA